jgi:hypothetical protein
VKTKIAAELLTAATNARRLLLMVAELHKLGYEGLRATPFMSPSGCYWRCCIVPACLTSHEHGARLAENVDYETLPRYSSGDEDNYFGWANMKPKSPSLLAKRFILVFPNFAQQGKHPDPAYMAWYSNMLEATAPHGVIYAFANMEPPIDRMLTEFCNEGVVVPLPPVGLGRCEIRPKKASPNINNIGGLFSTRL